MKTLKRNPTNGVWVECEFADLRPGDHFKVLDTDGTSTSGPGKHYRADSLPYLLGHMATVPFHRASKSDLNKGGSIDGEIVDD